MEKWSEELNKLDESLSQKSVYEQRKLDEIKALKRNLRTASQADKFKSIVCCLINIHLISTIQLMFMRIIYFHKLLKNGIVIMN